MASATAAAPESAATGPPALDAELTDDEREHPFVKTLPPETDYLTYLTIVEYNLDRLSLGLLHKLLLRDERLTTNIGWDLVQLLLPLLPESKPCLDLVARMGNPREVIIKVDEMLDLLGRNLADTGAEATLDDAASSSPVGGSPAWQATAESGSSASLTDFSRREGCHDQESTSLQASQRDLLASSAAEYRDEDAGPRSDRDASAPVVLQQPSLVQQYRQMLHMIGLLHPRIKTKHPSKFLVTTLESVLRAYSSLGRLVVTDDATDITLGLLKDLSSVARPPLPPRGDSHASSTPVVGTAATADDPEAEPIDSSETSLQRAILISFATRLFESYTVASRLLFPPDSMTWTTRYMARCFPGRSPPLDRALSRPQLDLLDRVRQTETWFCDAMSKNLALRRDRLHTLLALRIRDGHTLPPSDDFEISRRGALLLLAASEHDRIETDEGSAQFSPLDHQTIVERFLGSSEAFDLGPLSLAVVDALLLLGWAWMSEDIDFSAAPEDVEQQGVGDMGTTAEQDRYNQYLQQLSFVSSNAPSPVLRYQVHHLVTKIIRNTRQAGLRLTFIRDTLEFCPFQNLRVTAVGWFKDEVLAAFTTNKAAPTGRDDDNPFRHAETLQVVGASIFEVPQIDNDASSDDSNVDEGEVSLNVPFWLAALNFLYLLCMNADMRSTLRVKEVIGKLHVSEAFVRRLEGLVASLGTTPIGDGHIDDASLISDALSRTKDGLCRLEAS